LINPFSPESDHFFGIQFSAFFAQVVKASFFIVNFRNCRVKRDADFGARFVTRFFDAFQNQFDGFLVGFQRGGKTTLITDQGAMTVRLQNRFQGMVDFSTPAQAFREIWRAQRHDHKFLEVRALPVAVRATVHDVKHRHWQSVRVNATDVAIKGHFLRCCSSTRHSQAGAKHGVRAKFRFVFGTVKVNQQLVDCFLLQGIQTKKFFGNFIVHIIHSGQNSLATVAFGVTIAQFKRFVNASRRARRHSRHAKCAVAENNFNLHSGITT